MFALCEIVKERLYALADADGSDVFHRCYENWQDVSYLYDFFKNNPDALTFYRMNQRDAVQHILNESELFFDDILNIAEGYADVNTLDDYVFTPLHLNDDFDLPIIETKAYGINHRKSFLRLYAIRLSDGAYIVVGGLIKTSRALQDTPEGIQILDQLRKLRQYLVKHQLDDSFEIGILLL